MCGVFGGIGNGITKDIICKGLVSTQVRGRDATGVYQPKGGITKAPVKATDFVNAFEDKLVKDKMFIGHCRWWTAGDPSNNENNHPFEGEKYISVHNGTCPLMKELDEYDYKGECDSEVLHSYIETYGFEEGLKQVRGCATILVAPTDGTHQMYLWRHNNPLVLAYNENKNLLLVASTSSIIEDALVTYKLDGLIKHKKHKDFVICDLPEHELWRVFINDKGKVEAEFVDNIRPNVTVVTNTHGKTYGGRTPTVNPTQGSRGYYGGYYWGEQWHGRGYETSNNIKTTSQSNDDNKFTFEDCPDLGFNEEDCEDCPKIFKEECRTEAKADIVELVTKDVDEIQAIKGCDGNWDAGTDPCRTCILRTLCAYDILENWEEEEWLNMYYQPETGTSCPIRINYIREEEKTEPPTGVGDVDVLEVCSRCGYVDKNSDLQKEFEQYTCPRCEHVRTKTKHLTIH